MEQVLQALAIWIATNTGYETADIPFPHVQEMSAVELTQELYTGVSHLIPADGVDERVQALYAPGDGPHGSIYILAAKDVATDLVDEDDTPYDDPYFREILLHELIHHYQHASGRADGFPCQAYGESEAYMYGGIYLKQRNVRDPLPNRKFWAAVYSRC